jgi:hypothetical protein
VDTTDSAHGPPPDRARRAGIATTTRRGRAPHVPRWGRLALGDDVSLSSITYSQFTALVVNEGFSHLRYAWWSTTATTLESLLDHALVTSTDRGEAEAIVDAHALVGDECILRAYITPGTFSAWIAARDLAVVARAEERLRALVPVVEREERRVPVRFWAQGPQGARAVSRLIDVQPWADVRANYPGVVGEQLDALMGGFAPGVGGQLILWHGPPGTGKTHALRALVSEWRSWCDAHYITDPEVFFGEHSSYLLDVLLRGEDDDDERDEPGDAGRWRLLILEDTGELLSADAKERTGQGLSRLLNVVDGLIGQGFRILVLVTTNETVRTLHAAVARPGRCAGRIEFEPFPAAEAAAWLEARGRDGGSASRATLAELYGRLAGHEVRGRAPVGFALPD